MFTTEVCSEFNVASVYLDGHDEGSASKLNRYSTLIAARNLGYHSSIKRALVESDPRNTIIY